MGDINMDMTRSKIFNGVVYACAAVGAATGAVSYGGGTVMGMIGMGAVGAVAGGLGIPLAVTGVAVLGYVGYVGVMSTIKALKKEGAAVPLGLALIGYSAAKALFVEPVKFIHKMLTQTPAVDHSTHKPSAQSVDSTPVAARFGRDTLKSAFATALRPFRILKPAAKNTPQPPQPQPPSV